MISQPFWPAYLTADPIANAPNLKLAITAGIGSDHVDLEAAIDHGITVAEVSYCNSISVAEHVVMLILASSGTTFRVTVGDRGRLEHRRLRLALVRPRGNAGRHRRRRSHRLRGATPVEAFRLGLHYTDRHRLPAEVEQELGLTFHPDVDALVPVCDVVTINAPLHAETRGALRRPADRPDEAGRIHREHGTRQDLRPRCGCSGLQERPAAGYAGDVWFPQPAPRDHPWRTMPHNGMTPHVSGTSLSAQTRYAAGVRKILECWFDGRPIREEYLIVEGGKLAGAGAHAYTAGDTTGGAEGWPARRNNTSYMSVGRTPTSDGVGIPSPPLRLEDSES